MMKSKIASAAVAASLFAYPAWAAAMTAEETFAFIIMNVEDGDKFVRTDDGLVTVTVTAKEPLTYQINLANGDKAIYAIKQTKPCIFSVAANLGEGGNADITFDMNKLVGLPILPNKEFLEFSNDCAIQVAQNGHCLADKFRPGMMANPDINRERTLRAIDYFKKEFCAGAPF